MDLLYEDKSRCAEIISADRIAAFHSAWRMNMIRRHRFPLCPVRPNEPAEGEPVCPPCGSDDGWEQIQQSHIVPESWEQSDGDLGDVVDIDDDVTVQKAVAMPSPIQPSQAQLDAHNLTHWPYRSWCPHCVAARRQNSPHLRSTSATRRTIPLLVADYCFVRDHEDKVLAKVLVAKLEPSNLLLCTVVDEKGVNEAAVARLSQFIKESGYSHIAYRSDQELPLRALFEAAFIHATRQGELQLVPEASSVGESQSNGKAESAVKHFEDKLRTYKSALETRLSHRIPSDSAMMKWMVEHVCSIHNRIVCNQDGRTPFEAIHGQRWRGKMVEFGEQVFYFVPKKLRAKLNLRWRLGTFLGNAQATNECYVGAQNGDVIKTRSIVRVISSSRWSVDAIKTIKGTPDKFRPASDTETDAVIESLPDPHKNADTDLAVDVEIDKHESQKLDKQLRITKSDLRQFGYTDECPKCADIEKGGDRSWLRHNDNCKIRLYLAFKESDHAKWKSVRHLFEDPEFSQGDVDKEGKSTPVASPDRLMFENQTP